VGNASALNAWRHKRRNGLSPIPTINSEIRIHGEHRKVRVLLAHSDQAEIREVRGSIAKLLLQFCQANALRVGPELKYN
jgi:hypothetical protein